MNNVHIANFYKNTDKYIAQAVVLNQPVHIVTENGNAVLLSEEEYRGIQETIYLTSIPGMEKKLLDAKNEKGVKIDWKKRLAD